MRPAVALLARAKVPQDLCGQLDRHGNGRRERLMAADVPSKTQVDIAP